jgi:hypothetical protein
MRYELSNALPRPVTVKLLRGTVGDSRITAESQKSTAQRRDRRVGGHRARKRQDQSHRQFRDVSSRHALGGIGVGFGSAPAAAADIVASPPTDAP